MAKAIKDEIEKNQGLIGSSEGKDVVSFVGYTGAGKSTTVNLLAGIPMRGDEHKRYVLEDEANEKAMLVGRGAESVTSYPKGISVGERVFYDFPGFGDTRGGEKDAVNAALMYNIFKQAKSNLVAYVIGFDQLTSGRGEFFKKIIDQSQSWLTCKTESKTEGRCFIFTKSDEETLDDLKNELLDDYPQYADYLTPFFEEGRVFQIHRPGKNEVASSCDRDFILPKLATICGIPTDKIDIGVTLPAGFSSQLTTMFVSELGSELDSFYADVKDVKAEGSLDELAKSYELVQNKIEELSKTEFVQDIISKVEKKPEVSLLIPLCTKQWEDGKSEFQEKKKEDIENWRSTLNSKRDLIKNKIEEHWVELIKQKADEFINKQKRVASLGSQYSCSLYSARSKRSELNDYLGNLSRTKSSYLEMIQKEATAFQNKTKVLPFSGSSLPDYLEEKFNDFISSVRYEKRSVESFIDREEARIEREEAERRWEAERRRQRAEQERREREEQKRRASQRELERMAMKYPDEFILALLITALGG